MVSRIEWTERTWNPVRGCSVASPGCQHCYAARFAIRFSGPGGRYAGLVKMTKGGPGWTGKVFLSPGTLFHPLAWRIPLVIFVNSMSDLFHEDVPADYIGAVFQTMEKASWHVFQVLTKRADRLEQLAPRLPWPSNIWMGVSVENADYTGRVRHLQRVPAAVRFLSVEPLLGPIPRLPLSGIHWVIAGGESGPHARPVEPAWIRGIRDQCVARKVPFFFKQWGGVRKKRTGRMLDHRTWDEMPAILASAS